MIANFFQSLDRHHVEYLLISGQATVLYGAATFSEDIDLWLHATGGNCAQFIAALRDCGARYYKLTPPLTPEHLARGHGFHFLLPGGAQPEIFLDIMGAPPRVGDFPSALGTARWMETEWGRLRTIGLKPLVELKKTQRLEDYPIISKLALAWFDQPEGAATPDEFRWAAENIFTLPELRLLFDEHPDALAALTGDALAPFHEFGRQLRATGDVSDALAGRVNTAMQQRMAQFQQADRRYWRDIIAELKELRGRGQLLPEGSAV